jgi:type II secretory pathway component PulF
VEGGATLSAAMKQSPKVFDPLYTNMKVEAGETGGILDPFCRDFRPTSRKT